MDGVDDDLLAMFDRPPHEFVARRDALVKRLKADGDAEGAARLKALKRPTVVAWAVNRLALRHGDDVTRLLEAGAVLRKSQRLAVSGSRDSGLRAAADARRAAIDALAARASDLAAEDASPLTEAQRNAVVNTLEAASADAEAADLVRCGRLQKELDAPSGFGDLGGMEVLDHDAGEPATAGSGDTAEAEAEAEAAAAREANERALAEARAAVAAAEADLAKAQEAAIKTRQALTEVEEQMAALQVRADRLRERATTEQREADECDGALASARHALDSLLLPSPPPRGAAGH